MRTSLRIFAAACLAATPIASGALGGAAGAAEPATRTPYGPVTTDPVVLTDLCAFPVTVTGTQSGYLVDRPLLSGGDQLILHGTETDVFGANGHTLTGLPYTSTIQAVTDVDGNFISFTSEGVTEHVPLPQGGEFFAAGRIDWLTHPGAFTLINPDHGRLGNVEGLCAALA